MPNGIYLHKKGAKRSLETRRKMSLASKGKPKSLEHRQSLSKYRKENPTNYWLGKKRPDFTGENNPKWIKDRSKVKVGDRSLNDPLQKGWRKAVKDRDGWKCQIANMNCCGKLEAHHILPWSKFPELRYQINNGITLCHAHHPRKMDDVVKLSPYFQSLVASIDQYRNIQ